MNAPARSGITSCSGCGSGDLMVLSLQVSDGDVGYWSCSVCEATGWHRGGTSISRDAVLSSIPRR